MIQIFLLLQPTPFVSPVFHYVCLMDFRDYFQGVFPGPEKKSSRQWRKLNQLNTMQPFPFFICFASVKCSAFFWEMAPSCLFPRSWDERALQILTAPSQGLCYQTTQTVVTRTHLRETAARTMMSWPQGDPSTVIEGEELWVEDSWVTNELVKWTKGQRLHLTHWGNTCCVYLARLCVEVQTE